MSDRIPALLAQDILEAIQEIREFTEGMDFFAFDRDKKTKYAVLRCLLVIGEAVNRLPESVKNDDPEIAWSKIVRSRHIVAREYTKVDYSIVWRIVTPYLVPLKSVIEKILKSS
jgi:uncharacterized protein with HEPN domain